MSELDELTEDPVEQEVEQVAATPEPDKGETAETPAAPEDDKQPQSVPLAALQDERRKRQELEAEIERLRVPEEKPDIFVDPDAALAQVENAARQHADQRWIQACRAMAQSQFEDYGDKEATFMDLAKENPALTQQMLQSDNPALFAYQTAQKHERFTQLQNVDEYEAKLRAELEAKIRAEMAGNPRPDLTTAPSSGNDLPTDDDLSALVMGDA